jgi:hypothetical protein
MQNLIFKSGHAALGYVEKYFGDPYYLFEGTEDMKSYFGVVTSIFPPKYKNPAFDDERFRHSNNDPNFDFAVDESCSLCNAKITDFRDSHNPWPLDKDPTDRCCLKCNIKVISARLSGHGDGYFMEILYKKKGLFSDSIKRRQVLGHLFPDCKTKPNVGDLIIYGHRDFMTLDGGKIVSMGFVLNVCSLELDIAQNQFIYK